MSLAVKQFITYTNSEAISSKTVYRFKTIHNNKLNFCTEGH